MNVMSDPNTARKGWMGLLAKCDPAALDRLWQSHGQDMPHRLLRAPEVGSVMVRGRAGAVGTAFNLGEITVTRCSVRLTTGEDGHAYVQGRDKTKALRAALIDAGMQTDAATDLRAAFLTPLQAQQTTRKTTRAQKAAATKVDFFTMVRGED